MTSLDRGFKSWVERAAAGIRHELGLDVHEALEPARLAEHLDVRLMVPHEVVGVSKQVLDQLHLHDPWGWSAVSIALDHHAIIIYNPKHSTGRQASDIMHELAHIILDHKPGTLIVSQDGDLAMRSYDGKQEEEANYLAWGLLLPREALVFAKRLPLSPRQIAERYGVSEPLVKFRMNLTGVNRQFAKVRGRRS